MAHKNPDGAPVRLTEHTRAAGCAAKLAPGYLSEVLQGLPNVANPRMLVGFDTSDDACVFDLGDGTGLVQSVDFFPPMVDDPYLFGQVAATNALSDLYAMGAAPSHAMNLLCFPNCLGLDVAAQILAGGADKCVEAGCSVAGGHSINDEEPKYGLSVTGFVQLDRMLTNSAARPGDVLVLTKAIGVGILMTALKGGLVTLDDVAPVFAQMTTLNEAPIRLSSDLEVHACTDVTGFSLLGHSCEMAEGSGARVVIDAANVPVLDGAFEMAKMGIIPEGMYRNEAFFLPRVRVEEGVPQHVQDAFLDPQTSGGLLMALPEADAQKLVERLHGEGRLGAIVGHVEEAGESSVLLRA